MNKIEILSFEQLAYKLNQDPKQYRDKKQLLNTWAWFEKVKQYHNQLRKKND